MSEFRERIVTPDRPFAMWDLAEPGPAASSSGFVNELLSKDRAHRKKKSRRCFYGHLNQLYR